MFIAKEGINSLFAMLDFGLYRRDLIFIRHCLRTDAWRPLHEDIVGVVVFQRPRSNVQNFPQILKLPSRLHADDGVAKLATQIVVKEKLP